MEEIALSIWIIILIITLLGSLPFIIWVVYTAIKKQWKRLRLQIVASLVVLLYLVLFGVSLLKQQDEQYFENLYDTKVELKDVIFKYNSDRAFNGDGYSFSVYELPSEIHARFTAADERLYTEFPKHPKYRDHWNFEHWREAPFDQKFKEHLDFALSSYDSDNEPELTIHFQAILTALQHKGTFYALFYTEGVKDIDLFIIDLAGQRLYLINHNT